jgi:hypothetical protein
MSWYIELPTTMNMRSGTVILQVWTTLQGLHILLTNYAGLSHVVRDILTSGQETWGMH